MGPDVLTRGFWAQSQLEAQRRSSCLQSGRAPWKEHGAQTARARQHRRAEPGEPPVISGIRTAALWPSVPLTMRKPRLGDVK